MYLLENFKGKQLKVPSHKRMLVKFNLADPPNIIEEKIFTDINQKTFDEAYEKIEDQLVGEEKRKEINKKN